jgi:hypothetical protein
LSPYRNLVFLLEDSNARTSQVTDIAQELRFFVDFSGADARAKTLPKDLRRIFLSARPASYNGESTMSVRWAADDITNLPATGTSLTFSREHKPEDGLLRHHILEVAPGDVNGNNSGRRFNFVITPSPGTIIEAMSIEAIVRESDYATAYSD